jgi:UDP:flavonoid glycosyltransferase YjiC (YdhE family)
VATFLLVWELGQGLGHLVRLKPLAEGLTERGHRVIAVLKDVLHAAETLGHAADKVLQAPQSSTPHDGTKRANTYAQILDNIGFADADGLSETVGSWRKLFEATKPDVIVFDHSPTALLAAQGLDARRVVTGTGFCCPPDVYPLPNLRPLAPGDPETLRRNEDITLGNMNLALKRFRVRPLERVGQLLGTAEETFLTTFAELDHYPDRKGGRYRGVWTKLQGATPEWPTLRNPKIFAYLKPLPTLPAILQELRSTQLPCLVYVDQPFQWTTNRERTDSVRLVNRALDLRQVAHECDLAILNATHATTAGMLLAGKPVLQLPLTLEQALMAQATRKLGAAAVARHNEPQTFGRALNKMLHSSAFSSAARAFAAKYASFDGAKERESMIQELAALAER